MELVDFIFGPGATFTSNLVPTTVSISKSKFIKFFQIAVNGQQAAGSVPTIANLLGLMNPVNIKVGGTPEIYTRLADIYALDLLWLNHNPITAISAATAQLAFVSSLILPANFPPSAAEVTVEATFNSVTNANTTQASILYHAVDGIPDTFSYHYTEFVKSTSGTGSSSGDNWVHEFIALGDIVGVLFNIPTIEGGATGFGAGSINELFVKVNGIQKLHRQFEDLNSMNLTRGQYYGLAEASPADMTLINGYRWLPFPFEPIPSGSRVELKVKAGVSGDSIRDLVVQKIPFSVAKG